MEDLYYRKINSSRKQPIIYTQPESYINTGKNNSNINITMNQPMRNRENNNITNNLNTTNGRINNNNEQNDNNNNINYNKENNNYNNKNNGDFQRFRPSNITQAMDILLDKE